jgi:hypothetical protein
MSFSVLSIFNNFLNKYDLEDQHPIIYNKAMKGSKRTCSGTAKAATVNTIASCIDKTSYYEPTSKQAREMK